MTLIIILFERYFLMSSIDKKKVWRGKNNFATKQKLQLINFYKKIIFLAL